MAIRYIDKEFGANSTTAIANDSTGTAKIKNQPDAAGIAYDKVDNTLKLNQNGAIVPILTGVSLSSGLKVAGGTGTLDGTNPTTIATGLTTVVAFCATLIDSAGLGAGTAFLSHDTPVAGAVDVYAWVAAGTASTGTETFSWIAIGT